MSTQNEHLGIDTPGEFNYRGKLVEREHILDGDKWLNIPSGAREQVRVHVEAKGIKLHRYFHHLNSSQAFALALFVPFFEGGTDASFDEAAFRPHLKSGNFERRVVATVELKGVHDVGPETAHKDGEGIYRVLVGRGVIADKAAAPVGPIPARAGQPR